jgi:hypothetical protein
VANGLLPWWAFATGFGYAFTTGLEVVRRERLDADHVHVGGPAKLSFVIILVTCAPPTL